MQSRALRQEKRAPSLGPTTHLAKAQLLTFPNPLTPSSHPSACSPIQSTTTLQHVHPPIYQSTHPSISPPGTTAQASALCQLTSLFPIQYSPSFLTLSHLLPLTICFLFYPRKPLLTHVPGSTHPLTNVYSLTHHSPKSTYSPTKVKPPIY